jgi:DNA-directed RNA polymerase specialized sigma24 family protein
MSDALQPPAASLLNLGKRGRRGIEQLPLLLEKLNDDRHQAGVIYEDLRRRLIIFFRLRRPQEAEELADEVLDRVARRLSEGTEIQAIEFYMVGVARFVLRERHAASQREELARTEMVHLAQMSSAASRMDASSEETSAALNNCLQNLAGDERAMILSYYEAEGSRRIESRLELAKGLGISLNALHNRALRLRKQLERCVETKTRRKDERR